MDASVSEIVHELDEQKYEMVCSLFERAFRDGQPPFLGDLENDLYKAILQRFKTF